MRRVRTLAPEPGANFEASSHFARYYCILISGFVERSVRILITDFAKKHGRPELGEFVSSRLERFTRVDKDELVNLVSSFNKQWGNELEAFLIGATGEALSSVRRLRHKIAHGDDTGVTIATADGYFYEIDRLITFLEGIYER